MVRPKAKRWWAWTLAREDAVVYRILDSRSQEATRHVLGDYQSIVMADGYSAYDALARGSPGFALAHCRAERRFCIRTDINILRHRFEVVGA